MSDNTVKLTIDGHDVSVEPGTGLVEAAASIGVEIPIFCYEPRIGPAVGACRMCLVEIEGMPKLQIACATAVREGMVVSTVGEKARTAQEAVLEFLLINHPLDCPVCDKGGECPLQDQALRWGAEKSRFIEAKRVNDKPIPVSPLIALDRERCILCYRCTRFSSEVSQDLRLIPRQRGAKTVISTFEGEPWEGYHSGNVIELCPVGALTSTQYRFRARPWEAPNHPSIATWDPVGTNIFNTVREGQVVRVLSRQNDDVDYGWLDDRTRFSYEAMNGPDRILTASLRVVDEENETTNTVAVSNEVAIEWLGDKLFDSTKGASELWVLSGTETLETAYAIQQLTKATGGRVVTLPGHSTALPKNSAKISDIQSAKNLLIVGDTDLLDDAPALELWARKARVNGAKITTAGIGGTRIENGSTQVEFTTPSGREQWVKDYCAKTQEVNGSTVVIYRDGELSEAALTLLTDTLKLSESGSGFLAISKASNSRGFAALGIKEISWDELTTHTGGIIWMGIDPEFYVDETVWVKTTVSAAWTVATDTLPSPLHQHASLVLPAASGSEQDGSMVNLEGRVQRLTVAASPPAGIKAPLLWISQIARKAKLKLPASAASIYKRLAEENSSNFSITSHDDIGPQGALGVSGGENAALIQAPEFTEPNADEFILHVTPFLYDAREVEYVEAMSFLRDEAKIVMNKVDARKLRMRRGDKAVITTSTGTVEVTVDTSSSIATNYARVHAGTPGFKSGRSGWHKVSISPAKTVSSAASSQEVED